jgi:hypothetical protein
MSSPTGVITIPAVYHFYGWDFNQQSVWVVYTIVLNQHSEGWFSNGRKPFFSGFPKIGLPFHDSFWMFRKITIQLLG